MNLKSVLPRLAVLLLLGAGTLRAQTISSFSPTIGSVGEQVTIYGSGFYSGIPVYFHGTQDTTANATGTGSIIAHVPNKATTGPITVGTVTTTADFTVIGPGPYITGFSNTVGEVGDQVIISGAHFSNPVTVQFGGVTATTASATTANQITAYVPLNAQSGLISVTVAGLTGTSSTAFTVVPAGPYILNFSATNGTVTIYGIHLDTVSTIRFTGGAVTSFTSKSYTQIQVTVPAGVTTGPISAEAPSVGTNTTSTYFYVPPTMAGISPTSGRANANVLVTGTSFLGATSVTLNGMSCSNYIVNNSNIIARVPVGASTGDLRVYAPAGSAFYSVFKVQPTITSFSPSSGVAGSTAVTIYGANLNVNATGAPGTLGTPNVSFGGVLSTIVSNVSFGQLTAVVPATATNGQITVTTTDGSSTAPGVFSLPAWIAGFSPTNSPPGSRITITGQNFTGTTGVSFNGTPATSFTVTNNTTMGATVPGGVTTGSITVTTPAGTTNSSTWFYGPLSITSFTPTSGLPGTTVTFSGTNFLGATVLFSNAPPVTNPKVTDTSFGGRTLTAVVPSGAMTGPLTVVTPASTNTTPGVFTLNYSNDLVLAVFPSLNPVTVTTNFFVTNSACVNWVNFDWTTTPAAPNVKMTNTISLGSATVVSATLSPPGSYTINGDTVVSSFGTVGMGDCVSVTLNLVPLTAGQLMVNTTAGSDYPDRSPSGYGALITVLPLPQLSIKRWPPNQVRVSWPQALTNYTLQYKSSLDTNVGWLNDPVSPGTSNVVIEPRTNATRFYRLRLTNAPSS